MTWTHHTVVLAFLFGVGATIGSFLNVCIYRIPARMNLLWPRSRCLRCASAIAPRDNVPILGWLVLRGRCRSCGQSISARYPIVEALVGALFAAVYPAVFASASRDMLDAGLDLVLARLFHHALLIALLITAAFIGHDTGHVPRWLTVTGIALGLALGTLLPGARPEIATARTLTGGFEVGALGLLLGASLAQFARLLARWAGCPEAIGRDDVALLAMIGVFLGWQAPLPILLLAVVLACVLTIFVPRRSTSDAGGRLLAFSPFLGTAALLLLLARPFQESRPEAGSPSPRAEHHAPHVLQGSAIFRLQVEREI